MAYLRKYRPKDPALVRAAMEAQAKRALKRINRVRSQLGQPRLRQLPRGCNARCVSLRCQVGAALEGCGRLLEDHLLVYGWADTTLVVEAWSICTGFIEEVKLEEDFGELTDDTYFVVPLPDEILDYLRFPA